MEKKLRHCSTFIIADTDAVDLVAEVLPLDLRVSHHLKVDKVQCFCHHWCFSISVITTLSWTCSYCLAKLFKNLYCSSKVRYLGMISNKSVFVFYKGVNWLKISIVSFQIVLSLGTTVQQFLIRIGPWSMVQVIIPVDSFRWISFIFSSIFTLQSG